MRATEPIVITESLGGSALSRAARAGQLPQWYRVAPRGGEWRAYVESVRSSVSPDWYAELEPAFAASGVAAERLARSAGGRGIVVTTGQQPGLFGGPLMTFNKALAARALADVLEEQTGIPVAPVFWAATDDADFDEASVVSVALGDEAPELAQTKRPPAGTPMSRAPIDAEEIEALAAVFRDAAGTAPHASYLVAVLDAYRGGVTIGDAYVSVMRAILEPLGIAVLDASHPAFMNAASTALRPVAIDSVRLDAAVSARASAIIDAGFTPQVEAVKDLSLVFVNNDDGTKRRLTLREAAAFDGGLLSSTVLVRPVLERMLLPTAAYLGGPGEVAYFAQVTAVAETLGVPTPLVLPRWSGTILEPKIQDLLRELNVDAAAFADPHAVETRIARQVAPPDVQRALSHARANLTSDIDALKRTSNGLVADPAFDGLQRSIAHRLDRMERRLVAAVKRTEADAMRRVATARAALYPHGVRQERELSSVVFLARNGPPLVDRMLDAARAHAVSLVAGTPAMSPVSTAAPAPV